MKFSTLCAAVPLLTVSSAFVIPHDEVLTALKEAGREIAKLGELVATAETKQEAVVEADVQTVSAAEPSAMAPLFAVPEHDRIEDSYIVVFKSGISAEQVGRHHEVLLQVHAQNMATLRKRDGQHPFLAQGLLDGLKNVFSIGAVFNGYSGRFHADTIDWIRSHPDVAFVEHDAVAQAYEPEIQDGAPWGLARVSHRPGLSLGSFNRYLYDSEGGKGVTAYVIDTGSNVGHSDLEGRAKWGYTVPEGSTDEDMNGHGSHCSGTIAGATYGVAKKANIVAIKVLGDDGYGSMSDVIKGVELAVQSHQAEVENKTKGYKGATANLSLGGSKVNAVDYAINAAVKAGLHVAVAAGNDNSDACNNSPAAAELAVTVGATGLADDRASFSNYGKCVDVFAPGVNVQSIYRGSKHATAVLSGTSMASPHVCGLLTYFLSLQPETDSEFATAGAVTPAQLKKNLIAYGTEGIVRNPGDHSPNVLVFNGGGGNITEFWAAPSSEASTPSLKETVQEGVAKILPFAEKLEHTIEAEIELLFEELKEAISV